jgi:glycosyltransferase involved in cell wall biosynthesis
MVDWPVLKRLVAECPHVVSLSPTLAEITGARYIPNGIDESIFDNPKRAVVGYAGTNSAIKNPKLVEHACKELGLEFRAASYGGKAHRHTRRHDEMPEFYKGLDVYVHASSTEGFNNTVLEAISCNIPVLMTRVGAWREFEGAVTFIEPTVESIKEKLRPWCGRQLIMERFLWRDIIPKYGEIYDAINQSGAAGISPATRQLCGFAAGG